MDICYLYTSNKDGFECFLISIIDDHSRKIVGSGLYTQQTVCEVVEVLKAAVINYGVPHQLVCDNGSQFTCSEFRRVCAAIELTVDYAPPYYPQYKGKIERFFKTSRGEMPRSNEPEIAVTLHSKWIDEYNQVRIHSRVTDEDHHAQPPQYRFDWKTSAARPLPTELNLQEIFTVKRPQTGSNTRQVNAAHLISYRKQSYHFPHLHKGDVVEVKDRKDKLAFLYQGTVIMTVVKPSRQHSATTRIVKTGGIVLFHKRRFELNLPKGIHVLIIREGSDHVFYADGHVIFRDTGQERCQPGI